jgi:hypothetical protein
VGNRWREKVDFVDHERWRVEGEIWFLLAHVYPFFITHTHDNTTAI